MSLRTCFNLILPWPECILVTVRLFFLTGPIPLGHQLFKPSAKCIDTKMLNLDRFHNKNNKTVQNKVNVNACTVVHISICKHIRKLCWFGRGEKKIASSRRGRKRKSSPRTKTEKECKQEKEGWYYSQRGCLFSS